MNYEQEGQTITLHYEKQTARIQVLTNKVINVFVPFATNEHRSKAIEGNKELPTPFTLDRTEDCLILSTDSVVCRIYDDFMMDFYDREGNLLCADYRGQREPRFVPKAAFIELARQEGHDVSDTGILNHPVQCVKQLDDADCIYGLGDKTGVLNKRYYEYENWNSDIPDPHEDSFKSLYKSIPFFIALKGNGVYGIFYDNTFKSYFNFGKENHRYYSFGSDGGNLDYYFIGGEIHAGRSRKLYLSDRADAFTAKMGSRLSSVPLGI